MGVARLIAAAAAAGESRGVSLETTSSSAELSFIVAFNEMEPTS